VRKTARLPERDATTGRKRAPEPETAAPLPPDDVPVPAAVAEPSWVAGPCVAAGVESGALGVLTALVGGDAPAPAAVVDAARVVVGTTPLEEGVVTETVVTGVDTRTVAVGVDTVGTAVVTVAAGVVTVAAGVVTVAAGVVTVTAGVVTVTAGVVTVAVGVVTVVGTDTVGTVTDVPTVTVVSGVLIVVVSGSVNSRGRELPARALPSTFAARKPATAIPPRPTTTLPFTPLLAALSFVLSPSLSPQYHSYTESPNL
jgi:hypothetical protein